MRELDKFLNGKRVALVGPSPHLLNTNSGTLIDQYDVVARVNYFQTPNDVKKDYGSRTDLMFHNFATPWIPALGELIDKHSDDYDNVKFLACPVIKGGHGDNITTWSPDHVSVVVKNAESINKNNVPFEWIGVSNYMKIYNHLGCEPYSGTMAISMLLSAPIEKLFITGYTFYRGAKTPSDIYFDGYKTEGHKNRMPGQAGDAEKKSFEYFLELYKSNSDRIIVDEKLSEIIESES